MLILIKGVQSLATFQYDRKNGSLLNETEGRIWKFTVKGNMIEGTLTLPDKTVYRRVALRKKE